MLLLLVACVSSPAPAPAPDPPAPELWSVELDFSRTLFHTREISLRRSDDAQLALQLQPDGAAELKVGQRFSSVTRHGRHAPHSPNRVDEHGFSDFRVDTGSWTSTNSGASLRVQLQDETTLDCQREGEDLFCSGWSEKYHHIIRGEENLPWPGTRWIRQPKGDGVLWFGASGVKLRGSGPEQPVQVVREAVVIDPARWEARSPPE